MDDKTRILLVEDETLSAMYLKNQLERMGFDPYLSLSTGEGAVESVEADSPDLILMDINLGGEMDGIDAAGRIRRERDIPVIFITGYSDEALLSRARRLTSSKILMKPLGMGELEAAILSVFPGRGRLPGPGG